MAPNLKNHVCGPFFVILHEGLLLGNVDGDCDQRRRVQLCVLPNVSSCHTEGRSSGCAWSWDLSGSNSASLFTCAHFMSRLANLCKLVDVKTTLHCVVTMSMLPEASSNPGWQQLEPYGAKLKTSRLRTFFRDSTRRAFIGKR
jgi:hypothetical protein